MICLLIGHGTFASGLKSAYEMIRGKSDTIIALDLNTTHSIKYYKEEIYRIYRKNHEENIFILVDSIGGSAYNLSGTLLGKENVQVFTGMNLALVDACMNSTVKEKVSYAKDGIVDLSLMIKKENE